MFVCARAYVEPLLDRPNAPRGILLKVAPRRVAYAARVRIAVISTSYPEDEHDPSGHFVRAEVREMERAGHEVRVIAPWAGGAFGWPGVAARVRERPVRALDAAVWIASARRELRRAGKLDRVVAHWAVPCAFPIAGGAGGAGEPELEIVSHGGDVRALAALFAPVRVRVVRDLAQRAKVWRFVSESLRDQMLDALGTADRERVARIACVRPSPIEIGEGVREAGRAKCAALAVSRTAGARVAVTVGRLVASKRVDAVIEWAGRGGETLVVVGDGPERGRLEALARHCGADVRFVGKVGRDEALAWIAASDVLLHASQVEGLSTVVREAEALGVRVQRV